MSVSRATADAVLERDGASCVVCKAPYAHLHHRRPKRMGGSRRSDTDTAVNLVCLCEPCHRSVHSHGVNGDGYLLRDVADPEQEPLLWRGYWVFLTPAGTTQADSWRNHPSNSEGLT